MNGDMSPGTAPTGAIDWASESHVGAVVDHEACSSQTVRSTTLR